MLFKSRTFYLCLVIFLLGAGVGFFVSNYQNNNESNQALNIEDDSEFHTGGYKFINPLLECKNAEYQGAKEYGELENRLTQFIQDKKSSGELIQGSVYFRDLNNGPWFGVNEKADFAPSSLLKLPVMMAYYKIAEDDPSILSKEILFDKMPDGVIQQQIKGNRQLELGKKYTVEELIERMIKNSDNVALRLLEDNIDNNLIDKVTLDLGMPTAIDSTPSDFMSVKDYSTLFRILYNASYLSKQMSEKALKILSNTEYNGGLVDPISTGIVVAHKFGEREDGGINQLHDCGIVYYPNHPYLLCVMTKGKSLSNLPSVIQSISDQVFGEVDRKYKSR